MSNSSYRRGTSHVRIVVAGLAVLVSLVLGGMAARSVEARPLHQGGTVVRCNPAAVSGTTDETLTVDLYVENVTGLYGVDLRTTFDATIGQVVDENPATGVQLLPLSTFLSADYVARNLVDNTAGTTRYAATQMDPSSPANGSGPVARLRFTGLRFGTITMPFNNVELSDINGILIPYTAQSCTITFRSPLAVTSARFEAAQQGEDVLVTWETVSEIDNAGFNVYRSDEETGARTRLNRTLIPSQVPGSAGGGVYSWRDLRCTPGSTHFYWLENVDLAGQPVVEGPVSATCSGPTAVSLGSLDASGQGFAGLAGVVLLGAAAALYRVRRGQRAG